MKPWEVARVRPKELAWMLGHLDALDEARLHQEVEAGLDASEEGLGA